MNRLRFVLLFGLSLIAAVAISACGGDSGGDEDPQEVLEATFNNEEKIESGQFELSFDVNVEGGEDAGSLNASIGGPFQSGGDGAVPQFDLTADAELDSDAQDFSGSAGLISTGDSAFVNFQDTDYEVPADVFQQFQASYEEAQAQSDTQGEGNFFAGLGIDPTNWLTDLSNEGNEDVEGTETIHISGQADVPKLVEDLRVIAEKVPQATDQISPAQLGQLDQLNDLVESADFDVYTGTDDDILRKLEANVSINPPDAEGSPDSVDFTFALTLSDLGESQTISAPSGAQPLGDLLQQFGVDPSQLGALGSAAAGGSGGGGGAAATDPAAQAYLDCLANAQGAQALEECEALLTQ